ncbi:MAG: hypothetical protein H6814_06675 [Phycisphaeraceae bacterium]|nr:hypothetical protein [Phycisphaeraceae bacterium]
MKDQKNPMNKPTTAAPAKGAQAKPAAPSTGARPHAAPAPGKTPKR